MKSNIIYKVKKVKKITKIFFLFKIIYNQDGT